MAETRRYEPEVNKLFRLAWKIDATALCLRAGSRPLFWINGAPHEEDLPLMPEDGVERLLAPLMTEEHKNLLGDTGVVEFNYAVGREARPVRLKVFRQDGQLRLSASLSAES